MKTRILPCGFILYAGIFCAAVGKLIAYFYVKPAFYLSLSFFLPAIALYFLTLLPGSFLKNKRILIYISGIFATLSPLFLYFLYFIRPYTYYFSLIAIPGAMLVVIAVFILCIGIIISGTGHSSELLSRKKQIILIGLFFISGFLPTLIIPYQKLSILLTLSASLLIIIVLLISFIGDVFAKGIYILLTGCIISSGFTWYIYYKSPDLKFFKEQVSYEDMVVFHSQTYRHELTMVQWKNYYWLFIDGLKNLSSADDYLFYEPFIHPAVNLCNTCRNVLLLGGENGCAARELLKYPYIKNIDIIPFDTSYLDQGKFNPVFQKINDKSLLDPKIHTITDQIDHYIIRPGITYDLIVVDLPDPRNLDYNQFYIKRFYQYCYKLLRPEGVIVTQAGSPFYAPDAYVAIRNTIREAGFSAIPLHNQVMTLSEWGWIIGCKSGNISTLTNRIYGMKFNSIRTRWIDHEAMKLITSFGKSPDFNDTISVNTLEDPVVFYFYRESMKAAEEP
jgi:spermidine synthase